MVVDDGDEIVVDDEVEEDPSSHPYVLLLNEQNYYYLSPPLLMRSYPLPSLPIGVERVERFEWGHSLFCIRGPSNPTSLRVEEEGGGGGGWSGIRMCE